MLKQIWKENFFARAARPARAARAAHRLQHCSILRQEAPMSSSAHQLQKFQKLAKLRGRTRELLKKSWKEKYFRQVGFFWPAWRILSTFLAPIFRTLSGPFFWHRVAPRYKDWWLTSDYPVRDRFCSTTRGPTILQFPILEYANIAAQLETKSD